MYGWLVHFTIRHAQSAAVITKWKVPQPNNWRCGVVLWGMGNHSMGLVKSPIWLFWGFHYIQEPLQGILTNFDKALWSEIYEVKKAKWGI